MAKKSNFGSLKLIQGRKTKTGDRKFDLQGSKKDLAKILKAAIINKKLTIKDLLYQYETNKKGSFAEILIGAQVVYLLRELLQETDHANI